MDTEREDGLGGGAEKVHKKSHHHWSTRRGDGSLPSLIMEETPRFVRHNLHEAKARCDKRSQRGHRVNHCAPGRPLHVWNDSNPSVTAWQKRFQRCGKTCHDAQNSTSFYKISSNYNRLLMTPCTLWRHFLFQRSPFTTSTDTHFNPPPPNSSSSGCCPLREESLIEDSPSLQNEMSVFNPSRMLLWLESINGATWSLGNGTQKYFFI